MIQLSPFPVILLVVAALALALGLPGLALRLAAPPSPSPLLAVHLCKDEATSTVDRHTYIGGGNEACGSAPNTAQHIAIHPHMLVTSVPFAPFVEFPAESVTGSLRMRVLSPVRAHPLVDVRIPLRPHEGVVKPQLVAPAHEEGQYLRLLPAEHRLGAHVRIHHPFPHDGCKPSRRFGCRMALRQHMQQVVLHSSTFAVPSEDEDALATMRADPAAPVPDDASELGIWGGIGVGWPSLRTYGAIRAELDARSLFASNLTVVVSEVRVVVPSSADAPDLFLSFHQVGLSAAQHQGVTLMFGGGMLMTIAAATWFAERRGWMTQRGSKVALD